MIDRGDITISFSERVEGGGGGVIGRTCTSLIGFHFTCYMMTCCCIDQLHISVHIEHIEILIFTSFKIQESIIKSIKQSDRPWRISPISFSERVEGGGHWSHLHITNWIPFHVLHDDMLLY